MIRYLRANVILGLMVILAVLSAPLATAFSADAVQRLSVGTTMQVKAVNIDDYYFGIMRAMLTHKGLIRLGEDGRFTGDLAASWQTQDAKTWTFHLLPGLTWHDGKPVTAEDVRFSIMYLIEKIPVYGHHFKLVESVKTINPLTLVITLSTPNPRFLVNLAVLRTLPGHIFSTVEDPRAFQGEKAAVGCGPYRFAEFDPAAGIVRFTAYDDYYRGRPHVDEVVFRTFKNPDTLYMALKKGAIDLPYFYAAGADPVHAAALAAHKGIKVYKLPNPGVPKVLFFNTQKPPMNDARFRRAISLAVDYDEMIRLFAAGSGSIPNAGFVPEGTVGFVSTPRLSYNPQKARDVLSRMGYEDTDQDGFRENRGRPLVLEIVIRTDIDGSLRIAELLKKRLAHIGVKLDVRPVDANQFRQISDADKSHSCLLSRTTPWGMMMWAGCGSGYFDSRNIGWANLSDKGFHAIVDRMNAAVTPEAYETAAADLQRYYADRMPGIPLFWSALLQPARTCFSGWKISPMYGFLWEETWYSLEKE